MLLASLAFGDTASLWLFTIAKWRATGRQVCQASVSAPARNRCWIINISLPGCDSKYTTQYTGIFGLAVMYIILLRVI